MIYRIAEATDWSVAQRQGFFASSDLAAEGFIHFSATQDETKQAPPWTGFCRPLGLAPSGPLAAPLVQVLTSRPSGPEEASPRQDHQGLP